MKAAKPRPSPQVERFCRALWRHEAKVIAALVSKVPPNGVDRFGFTPLLLAAQYGDVEVVSRLLARGATVDQRLRYLTPVTLAARRRAEDIVQVLKEAGGTISLFTQVHLGQRREVERALERDPAQARLRDEQGTPLLHHAVQSLRAEMVALLLDHGAAVDDTDAGGETALHQVSDLRRAPEEAAGVAALLLDRGAEVDARNWDQVTPLHQAVRARNLAVVELLLKRGADVNARDKGRGSTPLRRAVSPTGASATAGTDQLMVPLTRLLLEHGADPDARDKRGVRVRDSARAPEVVAVLEELRRKRR